MEDHKGFRTLSEEDLEKVSGGVTSQLTELQCSLFCSSRQSRYRYEGGKCFCEGAIEDDWLQTPKARC